MKYFGFMVNELTGEVDDLYCEVNYKPRHETAGFSYAKWFTNIDKRDKIKQYTIEQIKKIQNERRN